MSELKVYVKPLKTNILGQTIVGQSYYLKSEADKVIADKDKEIAEQKRLRDMALASVPNVLKVMKIIQHHKYKRCLAMAKYCDMGLTCYNEKLDRFSCERADFFYRWYNRWWKLAEKFKEEI